MNREEKRSEISKVIDRRGGMGWGENAGPCSVALEGWAGLSDVGDAKQKGKKRLGQTRVRIEPRLVNRL